MNNQVQIDDALYRVKDGHLYLVQDLNPPRQIERFIMVKKMCLCSCHGDEHWPGCPGYGWKYITADIDLPQYERPT